VTFQQHFAAAHLADFEGDPAVRPYHSCQFNEHAPHERLPIRGAPMPVDLHGAGIDPREPAA